MADVDEGIDALFTACDLDGSGFIDKNELSMVCANLSPDELNDVFQQLDSDGDGKISIAEFSAGFQSMRNSMMVHTREKLDRRRQSLKDIGFIPVSPGNSPSREATTASKTSGDTKTATRHNGAGRRERRKSLFDLVGNLDEAFTTLRCQEQLCELYQQLYDAGQTDLLSRFEDVVVSIIKDVRQQQCENERLERSYKREKDEHARHLRQLEEEMETQMQKVENRVRKEDKEKHDAEKEELKNSMETEISELQENLKRLQQLNVPIKTDKPVDEYRVRFEEVAQENRLLKRQLTDVQTTLALQRSEVANARSDYEEKCYDLETEKQTLMEYVKEHENLTRQIQLLHDANKKLHDTNDDLREALESARLSQKRPHATGRNTMLRSVSAGSRCEYVRKYLQDSALPPDSESCTQSQIQDANVNGLVSNEPTSLAEELSVIESERCNTRRLLPAQDSCEMESFTEDIDSGHFTMRDVPDDDSDDDSMLHPPKRNRQVMRGSYRMNSNTESQMIESFEESEQDRDHVDCQSDSHPVDDGGCSTMPPTRSCSFCSHSSSRISRQSSECTTHGCSGAPASSKRVHQITVPQLQSQKQITQEPERIFKIVLAGDAAVGKSSFIMRLCKNKFVTNLNSTLGVDFQTKTLEVDGRVIALQLWDTAGQERFRSIAKSYFRRADGVLLLYDVTYERSFISVRDWLEAIEEGAQKQIPIMLVGNKSDLRTDQAFESSKVFVKAEEGQRLAREFRGLFIESSAKEGNNILEAVTELSRMLMTNEDLEVQTIGLKLQDSTVDGSKKKSPCCNI